MTTEITLKYPQRQIKYYGMLLVIPDAGMITTDESGIVCVWNEADEPVYAGTVWHSKFCEGSYVSVAEFNLPPNFDASRSLRKIRDLVVPENG